VIVVLGCLWLEAQPQVAKDFRVLSSKATAAREADRLPEAISLYRQALTLRPAWAEGWFYLGTLHYDRNEYSKAARAFRKLVALQPKSGTGLVMLGLCEFELKEDVLALKHLQNGSNLGFTDDPRLRHALLLDEALLLQRKERFEQAQQNLEQLCREEPEQDEVLPILAMVQVRAQSTDPQVTSPAGHQVIQRLGRAGCLAAQKKFDEARSIFQGLVGEFPDYPNLHYAFGNFLVSIPDIAQAKLEFEKEIQNNPKHILARLKAAAALYRTDSAAGILFAREAVALDRKMFFAHYLLGLLLLDTDDYKRAIPELEFAQKGLPSEPKLYFALGTAYARSGRTADAERARSRFQQLQKSGAANSPD
jgi:tetratricopeptide (TPR) repeat protein